jgi:hypothetical protein
VPHSIRETVELAPMSTVLDGVISERISFLREQIRPYNKPAVNNTFRLQAEILQSAGIEKLDKSINEEGPPEADEGHQGSGQAVRGAGSA